MSLKDNFFVFMLYNLFKVAWYDGIQQLIKARIWIRYFGYFGTERAFERGKGKLSDAIVFSSVWKCMKA